MNRFTTPLLAAFFAFLAGLLLALRFGSAPLPLAVAAAVLAGAGLVVAEHRAVRPVLLAAFMLVGAAMGGGARASAERDCRVGIPEGTPLLLRGVLAANATGHASAPRGSAPLFPLRVTEARTGEGRPLPGCGGEIRVRFPKGVRTLDAGSEIGVRGEWVPFAGPVAPSGWPGDPRYTGFVRVNRVEVLARPSFREHPLLFLRGATERHLARLFPQHAALADALLLDRKESLDPDLRDRFARAGLAHLLAISGSHVALLAGMLLLVSRALPVPRRAVPWITLALIFLYLGVIGAPPSALRAGIMVGLALLGVFLQRPCDPLPIVGAAALAILVVRPLAVLEPGFQLSFAGVLGILLLREALLRWVPERWLESGWTRAPIELLLVSFAAFVATAPITAHHFGVVSPIAILANLIAIPASSLALIGIVLAAIVEPLVAPLGGFFALGAGWAMDALDWTARRAAAVPGGSFAVSRPSWLLWALGGIVVLLVLEAARGLRRPVRWAAATGTLAALVLVWPALAAPDDVALEIHILDVGQGDAIAVRTPADRWVLIDAGPRGERFDAGERRVLPFLRAHRVRRLEALILTHPDADHIGGAPAVLGGVEVGRLVDPGLPVGKPLYLETLRVAEAEGVPWMAARSGRSFTLDGVTFALLWPDAETLDSAREANEISAVLQIRYADFSMLLPGDAPAEVERLLVARHGPSLRSDILKAGHHGSRTSTAGALLDAVDPSLVVVSAGRGNRYGHPTPTVLKRIRVRGVAVARTDRDGTVSVRVGPDGAWQRVGS